MFKTTAVFLQGLRCLLFPVVTVATGAFKLCPEQSVVFHIEILQSIGGVRLLWSNSLTFNWCFLQTCSPLPRREGCPREKSDLSAPRCNFRWIVMCHESQLLNYSVSATMTTGVWCIQIAVCVFFSQPFLIFSWIRYCLMWWQTQETLQTCFTFISLYADNKNTTHTHI